MTAGSASPRSRRDPLPLLSSLVDADWARPQPEVSLAALAEAAQGALGFILFTVLVHDAAGGTMRRVFSTRPDVNPVGGTKPVTDSPWTRQVLQRGEPYIGRTREDLRAVFFDHEILWSIGCGSVLNMPIVWDGRVLGSLNMLHEEGWYEEADVPIARLLAQLALPTVMSNERLIMTASPQTSTFGSVASTDGSATVYRDFGGRGPVLVLLPGWACVQAMWEPVVPFLEKEFRVVSLDFPGFGRSTAGDRGWTMQEFAEDVRTVVEHLDLRNVSLVGHSMGGAVALEAARLCGDRVVAVIGCDSFTYPEVYKRVDETVIAAARTAYGADFAGTVRAGIAAYLLDGGDPVLATHVADVMAGADPKYAVPAMEHLLRWDVDQGLADCPVPVAGINARRFLKAEAEREYEGRIRIETIDEVGHFLMMERPEAFAEALRKIVTSM